VYPMCQSSFVKLSGNQRTAQEEDLYVIARPGPYQYSELVYHGLPGWLVQKYPEILAQMPDGKLIDYASVSYTHPLFLEKVRNWFDAVLPVLARYTLEQGGPIAFVQIDNELVGIHEWYGGLDYHPVTMGIGQPGGVYPAFLEKRYGSLEMLNQSYTSSWASFTDAHPTAPIRSIHGENQPGRETTDIAAASIRRKKDYFDFYLSTISDYAQRLTEMIRQNGIREPIMHNSANPGMNAYFLETAAALGGDFLLGSDHYYNLSQDWDQNNPTPQYAAKIFISLEMLRLMGYPPSVLEMPGGSASNWPPLTPTDAFTAYMTNLAYGMKGVNYYIFTGGPNPPGAGSTTDLYDYDAGIGANGEIRPLYDYQKEFGQFVHANPAWLTSTRLTDFRIALDFEYSRAVHYWPERGPFLFSNLDAWKFLRQGVLSTALCASLSPEFVNLNADDWTNQLGTPLVVASSVSMGREKQQRLVTFLQNGGRLLIAPLLPMLDEQLQPCTLLRDFLQAPAQESNANGLARARILDVVNVNGTTYPFASQPEEALVLGEDAFSGRPIALQFVTEGGGQAVVLGLQWRQAMREHERMLRSVLTSLGINPVVECSNPNLWATAYTGDKGGRLFILNLFTAPMQGRVRLRLGSRLIDSGMLRIEPITVRALEFD
jgi:beta-galactosidase